MLLRRVYDPANVSFPALVSRITCEVMAENRKLEPWGGCLL